MKYGFSVPNNFGVDDPAEVVGLAVGVTELVISWNIGDVAVISQGLASFAGEHCLRS
ncbi:hypothetical protein [Candidatus Poriferisodalis sp.]|uniref:hypothetical protein n=1 Tax=Candidatus Poriferisodalis sp. TaxID=3101277 RepID=UPI003B5BAB3E